jgi:NAD(P)-dependent dehydrogenase (short-subunit alcohol dehydrogenase family)
MDHSLSSQLPQDPGHVSLVTGGTDGIGRAVAIRLARAGSRVLITGRDPERGAEVLAVLATINPGAKHAFVAADLSLLSETSRLADDVRRHTDRLDAVVCCAGILSTVPDWTPEGLERTLVLNYLSRHLLARLLIPMLADVPSGRLVLVANAGKYPDTLDFDDLQHRRGPAGLVVSGRTQFANDLLAVELSERLKHTRMEVTCVYPGVVKTALFQHATGLPGLARRLAPVLVALLGRSPDAAADTPAWLAHDPDAAGRSGQFFGPRRRPRVVPERARRLDRRTLLWAASEELVHAYLPPDLSQDAGVVQRTAEQL